MFAFDFQLRTRFVCGANKIDSLGALAGELGSASLGRERSGHYRGRSCRAGHRFARGAGIQTHLFDGVTENPTTENVEAGLAMARRYQPELLVGLGGGSSMDCTGDQLPVFQRRPDAGLLGRRQGDARDVPHDCRADDFGHGERSPIVRFDLRRPDACEDGLRRQESRLPHCAARSYADGNPAAAGDRADRHRCGRACLGNLCDQAAQRHVATLQPRGLAIARSQLRAACWRIRSIWKPAPACNWGLAWRAWRSSTRCWGRRMPWPIR